MGMNAVPIETPAGRFALPALLAATGHVALLCLYPTVGPDLPIRLPDPPVVTIRPIPYEPVIANPTPDATVSAPVRTMNAGPVRPVTEDRSLPSRIGFAVEQSPTPWKADAKIALADIPAKFGDGTSGPRTSDGLNGDGFLSATNLDRVPRARLQVAPVYPVGLRQAGVEGSATVEFEVDSTGVVVSARARQSTAREFEEAAVRAVLRWRFEPGRKDGRVVPFRMIVPIGFRLGAE